MNKHDELLRYCNDLGVKFQETSKMKNVKDISAILTVVRKAQKTWDKVKKVYR